jgi:hypothetical protein
MLTSSRHLFVPLLLLMSCDADEPCDPNQTHEQGVCTPTAASTDASAKSSDAAADAQPADATSACKEERSAILGKACTADSDCNCAAPFCAVMPGQPMGLCTVYCHASPDDCPDGYRCFDLSALGVQGYEPFCLAS